MTFGRVITARTAGGQTSSALSLRGTLRVRLCESQSDHEKKCDLEYSHCRWCDRYSCLNTSEDLSVSVDVSRKLLVLCYSCVGQKTVLSGKLLSNNELLYGVNLWVRVQAFSRYSGLDLSLWLLNVDPEPARRYESVDKDGSWSRNFSESWEIFRDLQNISYFLTVRGRPPKARKPGKGSIPLCRHPIWILFESSMVSHLPRPGDLYSILYVLSILSTMQQHL